MTSLDERHRILIVDDIPENLTVLEKILSELEVDVVRAGSGNEALKATLYNDFSMIILDLMMPGMNGVEVAEMLKQEPGTSDIPIIFVTAMDRDEAFELKAYGKGAVDFIYKPFNKFVLISKVRVLLDLYSMKRNLESVFSRQETEQPKILVVDDTPDNILVFKKLLTKLDVEVVAARSGNEALAETLYNDFAVIFLDVQMPEMDGYEVAEILKSDEKTANIPIIFVTAIDREDAKEIQGYDTGAVDFIFKPFNEYILLSKARVFIDIYKLRAGLESLVQERTTALSMSNRKLRKEILEKEATEKTLLHTQSYLSSILNSIHSVLIGADSSGVIIDMNKTAAKISGASIRYAKGKNISEIFPFYSTIIDELLLQVRTDEPVEKTGVTVIIGDSERVNNFAVYPSVGELSDHVVIRVDDVTEAKQMEVELQQRRHIDSLGQLAGGIAHDFNNMLSAIMGAAELLRIKIGDNPDLSKQIGSIVASVERSADLTGKLLSFARKTGSEKTSLDIHRLIKDTVIILQRSIDKRINIIVEPKAVCSIIDGDDSELSNALLNLGINARDAMPDGGTLTISTENRIIKSIKDSRDFQLKRGKYVELKVSDTGTGMTEDVRKKAFEPFFTTKPQGKGTGLGLASVYGTIKSHHGTISLRSRPESGTAFTVLLPVNERAEIANDLGSSETDIEKINGTVLLVDDEDIVRTVGTELLQELGLDVITANNGRRAIDIVKEKGDSIVLILLDMIMPELNGRDCYREIRKILPDVNVIICSGYAPEEMISDLYMEGIRGFIRKPFRLSELSKVIKTSLSSPST